MFPALFDSLSKLRRQFFLRVIPNDTPTANSTLYLSAPDMKIYLQTDLINLIKHLKIGITISKPL